MYHKPNCALEQGTLQDTKHQQARATGCPQALPWQSAGQSHSGRCAPLVVLESQSQQHRPSWGHHWATSRTMVGALVPLGAPSLLTKLPGCTGHTPGPSPWPLKAAPDTQSGECPPLRAIDKTLGSNCHLRGHTTSKPWQRQSLPDVR